MRIPTDLDILPPRPVLFPWISEDFLDLGLNCCWGGGSVGVTTTDTPATFQQKFSFGSDDYYDTATGETKQQQQQRSLTPATQPLSPSELSSESESSTARSGFLLKPLFGHQKAASHGTTTILVLQDDTLTDDIPDMSPSNDTLSESGNSYRTEDEKGKTSLGAHKKQKNAKLVTLEDIIAEVLRVVMFFLSATGNGQKALVSQKKRKSEKVASR